MVGSDFTDKLFFTYIVSHLNVDLFNHNRHQSHLDKDKAYLQVLPNGLLSHADETDTETESALDCRTIDGKLEGIRCSKKPGLPSANIAEPIQKHFFHFQLQMYSVSEH